MWDGRRGELVLARDFLGKRPLLYHRGGHALRWASEVQAVLADPAVPRRPNVAMVGERLSLRPRSTTETLYEGVERVPPAHLLVITDGRVQVQRHWDWDRAPVARRSATDHVAELLDTCCDAVEACLDAPGPVAAELSGGVDSSSVVALADRVVRAGRAASPLELLALVFPGAPHDETQHIRAVAQHVGRPVAELQPTPAGTDHYLTQITRFLDLPESPIVAMRRSLHALAREHGARVLLTGEGGDEWFTGSPLVLADAFRTGRPGAAWRTARAERGIWDSRGSRTSSGGTASARSCPNGCTGGRTASGTGRSCPPGCPLRSGRTSASLTASGPSGCRAPASPGPRWRAVWVRPARSR